MLMPSKFFQFFLVTAPGLEELALTECQQKISILSSIFIENNLTLKLNKMEAVKGGVELEADLGIGWLLNHYLRIPSRILQRIAVFQCRRYDQLQKKVSLFSWREYLRQGDVKIHVAHTRTRLNRKKNLIESIQKGIDQSNQHQPFRRFHLSVPQQIFLRIEEDQATLSIDTSGDLLYRRGYKLFSTLAPLRETLASALYWLIYRAMGADPSSVLDPMCGSGTLGLESLHFWNSLQTRQFAYQNFPIMPQFGFLNTSFYLEKNHLNPQLFFNDIDLKALVAVKENYRNLTGESLNEDRLRLGSWESLKKEDFYFSRPLAMVLNPPYNRRLALSQNQLLKDLRKNLEVIKPDLLALVWPGRSLPRLSGQWVSSVITTNGGIPVVLGILKPA